MVNYLLISAFAVFFASGTGFQGQPPCESLSAEVRTEPAGPSSSEGKIKVKYGAGVQHSDLVLRLYGGEQKLRLTGVTEIANLKPGKYLLVISDNSSRYCFKNFDIEITP